jgi:hypothetical protein
MRRLAFAVLALVLTLALAPGGAGAKGTARKNACPAGQLPQVTGTGKHAKPARDRKGRLKCAAAKRPVARQIPQAASPTPTAQLGVVADELESVLTVHPDALKPIARRLGSKRTTRWLAIALDSWRTRAVAAGSPPPASARTAETKSDSYSPVDGADVKFAGEFKTVDDGTTAGYSGKATVEGDFNRAALDELAKKVDVALPKEIDQGRFKLELEFSDLPAVCPDASGKVKGTLKAGGRITLSVGATTVTMAARIDVSYNLQVGDDARWQTIDDVDVKTELSAGGTGRSTETWRGRRVGGGFGTAGIFDKGADAGAAIGRDWGHIDPDQGGVFGPHGGVNLATGKGTLLDVKSIDNFKKMLATNYATQLITLAAVEYVRQVAAERVQRVWYDGEKCLKIDASSNKSRVRANEQATITAKNARAHNGAPVATSLTASGTKQVDPGSAQVPAGATKDFTLTAPGARPVNAQYKIVALSRAGKKTVNGELAEAEGPYTVTLDDRETGRFATHDATGHLTGTLQTAAVEGSDPQKWTASAPVSWTDLTATSKTDCSYADPQAGGAWTATITAVADDRIRVELEFTAQTLVTWTVVCEGGSVRGQAGTSPLGMAPRSFELPAAGGTQPVGGSVADGGDGFFTDGTLTVTPAR